MEMVQKDRAIQPELAGGGLAWLRSRPVEPKEMFDHYYQLVTIPETHAEFRPAGRRFPALP